MALREKLIRLAHEKPEMRKHLLPLIKEARGLSDIITGKGMRSSLAGHPEHKFLIEELPGKPVKRKVRRREWDLGNLNHHMRSTNAFMMENIQRDAKIHKGMSYDQAVVAMTKAVAKAVDNAVQGSAENAKKYPKNYEAIDKKDLLKTWARTLSSYEDTVSWLEVEPANYEPISFKGKDFGGTSKWGEFTFYEDSDPYDQQEGMRAFSKSNSKGAARKLFKLLKANPEVVRSMDSGDFTKWLQANKISYRYVPTVWR